jgi:hypothetical protein
VLKCLERVQDGLCIPQQQHKGCGTHGKPLCKPDMVDALGTLAVLQSPSEGQNWKVIPNLYEKDGCLFSCAPSCTALNDFFWQHNGGFVIC